ncbi:M14 family metallopeptidase [Porifericola rhodea]|uniref:M14 metallopeptidase family protein n=1 Tax=Porifericola rhodea TaxID=930972 RepID=UPI0026667A0C|nr:M14 metallopeptidase family protein [Porifericola rhodea]WKN33528.1 M14 family metallopeptidase [Porifericola rhodea]
MKHQLHKILTALCLFLCLLVRVQAQEVELLDEKYAFDPELSYDTSIPSPADFLGYELGEELTFYLNVVRYLETLAEASPKVTLGSYGKTYEGRELVYLVISSEANQQNIEEIRQNNLRLADPTSLNGSEADALISEQPVITSMSYNIHGNETSSTEAAMQVAYRLAAAEDEETAQILDNSVIIMYPCINPDGRDRYVYWYNAMKREVVAHEPFDVEHDEPWPQGRTNHYWFDLNRDWVWLVHPESRGHIATYQQWMPQVHVDYHEQGYNSNYFTTPGTTPRNLLLPDRYEALADTFGMANVKAFDENQISYFTREAFDFFYPGYGSSYPSVMGAIGMLTEQGGIGGGRAIETDDSFVLTLRNRVFDHYTTSFATFAKAAEHKKIFLQYFYNAMNPANSKSDVKAYILPDEPDTYLYNVIDMLMSHGVKVERAENDFSVRNAIEYAYGNSSQKNFAAGSFIISTNQPKHLFINSVMQRQMEIEDSVMYDMATWSAPLAYNLEVYSSSQAVNVNTRVLETAPTYASGVENEEASYAFVVDWKQRYAPKALALLWDKGYQVRSAKQPFGSGDTQFSRGSIIVLMGRNSKSDKEIQADMREVAEEAQVRITGLNSGRMQNGIDLSSRDSETLFKPKVAMLIDQPFSVYTSGQLWFLFDQDTHFPISRIRANTLSQTSLPKLGRRYGYTNLYDYDVLLLPGTDDMEAVFDKESLKSLKEWVSAGGTLIATEESAHYFTKDKSGFTDVEMVVSDEDSTEEAKYLRYEDREEYYGWKRVPGSALNANIDDSHPLAFGLDDHLYTLKFGSDALLADPGLQTVGYYNREAERLLASGYASQENLQKLAGHTFAAVKPMGQGKVVFLLDNTQYRMFWRGPSRMMQNAVMLLPGM